MGSYYGQIYKGWFIPPETTSYRFYMACDDNCKLWLGQNANNSTSPSKILDINNWSTFKNYFKTSDNKKRISEWQNLTKGEPYYIEARHHEGTGGDHLSIAVEIKKTATTVAGHHHSMRNKQQVIIQPKQDFDTTKVTIENSDNKEFVLVFKHPTTLKNHNSEPIKTDATASQFKNAVKGYYSNQFRSDISVNKTRYDSAGNVTTSAANTTKIVYFIRMRKLISTESSTSIMVAKTSTKATVTVDPPSKVQLSAKPFGGKYRIKCTNSKGISSYSKDINWDTWWLWIGYRIMEGCNSTAQYDKIYVDELYKHPYRENGRSFDITFEGLNYDVPLIEVESSEVSPVTGTNVTYNVTQTRDYSGNLWYDPIPFEFLKTYETKPQLMVEVDGLPAVCHNLTCDFSYVENVGEVTAFTYTGASKQLVIQGTALPSNISNIDRIEFAQSTCTVDTTSLSNTSITCTLDREPVCGTWIPTIFARLGKIVTKSDVTGQAIQCTVTAANPLNALNIIGGDNITFTGTNFPHVLKDSTVEIKFKDPKKTPCTPQISDTTTLVCLTTAFDESTASLQKYGIDITINGLAVTNTLEGTMMKDVKNGLGLQPNSASPVLKSNITIKIQPDFPHVLKKEDFTVNATRQGNATYMKRMNVIDVDDSKKELVVMFGGAHSDKYDVTIRHKTFGLVKTANLVLDVHATVTSVTPKTGSIKGGTLITITGQNFGTQKTDNPVQLSYNGGVGSTHCYVQTTKATEITCRIDESINKDPATVGDIAVFLKTSEEAKCDKTICGGFTLTGNIPKVTSVASAFSNGEWEVTLTGTDFTGTTSNVEFYVGTEKQTTKAVNSTSATFTVTNVTDTSIKGAKVYFDVGLPDGKEVVAGAIALSAQLTEITPSSGSIGGSIITAKAPGVGPQTKGVELVSSDGKSICQNVTIPSYGVVECHTKPALSLNSSEISIKHADKTVPCADPTKCKYEQIETANFPKITSVAKTSTTVTFTGTNFLTSAAKFDAESTLGGIKADSVEVKSDTEAVATWSMGVPPLPKAVNPELSFKTTETAKGSLRHYSSVSVELANDIAVTATSQGVQCSFAGGCEYKVTSLGLSTQMYMNPDKTYVSICGNKCEYQHALSTFQDAVCKLPALSTSKSVSTYKISKHGYLYSGKYFSSKGQTEVAKLFDKNNMNYYGGAAANNYAGMEFREGYVAVLSKLRFFIGQTHSISKYQLNTEFQGSNDGQTYTKIYQFDENVHQGWNYVEWKNETDQPKYRYYRFYAPQMYGCVINEAELTGVETVDDSQDTHACTPKLFFDGKEQAGISGAVTYSGAITPLLTSMSPRYGNVVGGEDVTFVGTGFSTDKTDYTITIDGVDCSPKAANATSVTCVTGRRPGLKNSTLEIKIKNKGLVSTQGKVFTYANYWSADTTWGGEFAPMEDESIYVPKGLNLLVDIDESPLLKAVIVEGQLIFAPNANKNHERYFDARYIFVHGGTMEVGTEEHPYDSKITITMHGTVADPYLPIYGNKVIGVREGKLDMHGPTRTPTWTELETTSEAGSNTITLREEVDWVAGEYINIAPTDFEVDHAEVRMIKSIDKTNPKKPVITLDKKLEHKHYAGTQKFGDDEIDMRAEVGLMTRAVKFRGDPETSKANEYGATIFMHSNGDDSLTARLAYVELTDVGQGFKLGRYAVHFHMIGNVHTSYVKGNSVHSGFNRAFTIHGNNYLRIMENVVYNVKGHNIFIEDAVERNNYIYKNLIMRTKRSWSGLNTDQTPAGIWITNPDNIFIDNHAAGSDRYGYWFDLQINAMGPSASNDICPENEKLGEFRGNTAHSNGRYGFRIFHNLMSRKFPCKPITYDVNNKTDPFWKNPIITNRFYNFTGWKNKRNGAIVGKVGDTRLINFKTADNILAGIEFERTDMAGDNMARVENGLLIGRSENTEEWLDAKSPHGIITPRSENFTVSGAKFFNYDFNDAAALGSCSHCFHPAATDSGSRVVKFEKLMFDSTVKNKIKYQYPYKAIYYDIDGTLTGLKPGSWATWKFNFLMQPECQESETHNGVICDNTIQVRRVAFHAAVPSAIFRLQRANIYKWDDNLLEGKNKTEYLLERSNWDKVHFRDKQAPANNWVFPIVTGHKYKISWAGTGIDFEQMTLDLSEEWLETDKPVYFVHNFTDVRAEINVTVGGEQVLNDSLPSKYITDPNFQTGQNVLYNQTEVREFHWVVTGKNASAFKRIKFKANRCAWGVCQQEKVVEKEVEKTERLWSDPKSWPNETLPKEGDDVHVESGWNMIYDLKESPVFKMVRINGKLTFKNDTQDLLHLRAKHIYVRAGELHIGSKEKPFQGKAKITLHGEKNFEHMVYDNAIEAGNKLIANVNLVSIWGKPRKFQYTRLLEPVKKGATSFKLYPGLELEQNDTLAIAPTSFNLYASDEVVVDTYDNATGKTTIKKPLTTYHYGAPVSTGGKYNGVDIRAEVAILTRNIQIVGEDIESWGGQIVTSDTIESDLTIRQGQMFLDHVEIYNASQANTEKAAIRFQGATGKHSTISNCAIHNGLAWGVIVKESANIHLENNIVFRHRPISISLQTVRNVTLDHNIVISNVPREKDYDENANMVDVEGAYSICSQKEDDMCFDISIVNNIAAGSTYAGFLVPAHDCGDKDQKIFRDNVAHSMAGQNSVGLGAFIFPDPTKNHKTTCYEGSRFVAYKCMEQGAFMFFEGMSAKLSNMTMIDNRHGVGVQLVQKANEKDDLLMEYNDMIVYGDSEAEDCPDGKNDYCIKTDKIGVIPGAVAWKGKTPHITSASSLPPYKIKGDSAWGGKSVWNRLTFKDYKAETGWGLKNAIIQLSKYQPDYTPTVEAYDTKFINVEQDAVAYIKDPNPKWANVKDCGDFPCTAPNNVLFKFRNTTWEGENKMATDFEIIADNDGFAPEQENCKRYEKMNAYICDNKNLGVLLFESNDDDWKDRSLQPIYVTEVGKKARNKLNGMMDHVWDGFYSGQIRLSRFPSIIDVNQGVWDLEYTASPPKTQTFKLIHPDSTKGVTIKIAYPSAMSVSITKDGKIVEMNKWSDELQNYGPIKQTKCGENRYIGVKNILEFYITGGCVLQIQPRNAIQTLVRMEWSLEDFYAKGGTTTFVDRIAGSLGIHASTIKVVSVYQGSLVVNYDITVDNDDSSALEKIKTKQTEQFATGKLDLGAPILDVATTSVSKTAPASSTPAAPESVVSDGIVSAKGYTPIVITKTETNKFSTVVTNSNAGDRSDVGIIVSSNGDAKSTFVPNVPIVETQTVDNRYTVTRNIINNTITIQDQNAPPKQEPEVISIVYKDNENKVGDVIVILVVVVIFIALSAFLGRHFYLKSKHSQDTAHERTLQKIRAHDDSSKKSFNEDARHPRFDHGSVEMADSMQMAIKDSGRVGHQQQYDPTQDFSIFANADRTKGGIMNLQDKMNFADDKNEASQEETDRKLEDVSTTEKKSNSRSGMRSDLSNPVGSITGNVSEVMPENREIVEDL